MPKIQHKSGYRLGTVSGVIVSVSDTKAIDASDGAYAAKDVISEDNSSGTVWTFDAVGRENGAFGYIVRAIVRSETEGLNDRVTLLLWNTAPTNCNLNDNAASTAPNPSDTGFQGYIPWQSMEEWGDDSVAIATPGTDGNLPLPFECASADDALYGVLIAEEAFTQTATDDITIELLVEQY